MDELPFGYVDQLFRLYNNISIITTTVDNKEDVIDNHISRFMSPTTDSKCRTKIFGFDIEWNIERDCNSDTSGGAIVQLCDGDSCLIIQLSWFFSIPQSLVNFLRHPTYTFVGFGIKDNVAKLEKKYGFGCTNTIELAPLAAIVLRRPRLSYCGVDELVYIVNQLDFRNDRPLRIGFKWWNNNRGLRVSNELAKHATINVYSYQQIGTMLMAQTIYNESHPY